MAEGTTEVGIIVGAVMVGLRALERFGDWAITKSKPVKYLTDAQDRRLYELHEWHKAEDPDTRAKLWYVPKTLGESMSKIAATQLDLANTQERILELLVRIERNLDT